jgi:hypothetical protein
VQYDEDDDDDDIRRIGMGTFDPQYAEESHGDLHGANHCRDRQRYQQCNEHRRARRIEPEVGTGRAVTQAPKIRRKGAKSGKQPSEARVACPEGAPSQSEDEKSNDDITSEPVQAVEAVIRKLLMAGKCRFRSLIPGLGVKLSNNILAGPHCSLRDRGKPSA